jgi:hypothetical protein
MSDGKNTPKQQCCIKKGIKNSLEYQITDCLRQKLNTKTCLLLEQCMIYTKEEKNKIQNLAYCLNHA